VKVHRKTKIVFGYVRKVKLSKVKVSKVRLSWFYKTSTAIKLIKFSNRPTKYSKSGAKIQLGSLRYRYKTPYLFKLEWIFK